MAGLIPCHPEGAKMFDTVWHSAVGAVLSQLWHLEFFGTGLKWDCADGFQGQGYPLVAAWVGDDLEQDMVAHIL